MHEYMNYMDDEIEQKLAPSGFFIGSNNKSETKNIPRDEFEVNANFKYGIIKSLDSYPGSPGPSRNIIQSLGRDVPLPKTHKDEQGKKRVLWISAKKKLQQELKDEILF